MEMNIKRRGMRIRHESWGASDWQLRYNGPLHADSWTFRTHKVLFLSFFPSQFPGKRCYQTHIESPRDLLLKTTRAKERVQLQREIVAIYILEGNGGRSIWLIDISWVMQEYAEEAHFWFQQNQSQFLWDSRQFQLVLHQRNRTIVVIVRKSCGQMIASAFSILWRWRWFWCCYSRFLMFWGEVKRKCVHGICDYCMWNGKILPGSHLCLERDSIFVLFSDQMAWGEFLRDKVTLSSSFDPPLLVSYSWWKDKIPWWPSFQSLVFILSFSLLDYEKGESCLWLSLYQTTHALPLLSLTLSWTSSCFLRSFHQLLWVFFYKNVSFSIPFSMLEVGQMIRAFLLFTTN